MTTNLTPVFTPSKKPARAGVYMASELKQPIEQGLPLYSLWDGEIWGCTHASVEQAATHPDFEFAKQQKYWRGLAEEPKA